MKHILARAQLDTLRSFTRARLLLAFDYDGTLAPITPDPRRADMRAATRELLQQVAERYRCIVISGRARADVRRLLAGVRGVDVIGNHGIETQRVSGSSRRAVQRWLPLLSRRLERLSGVVIENKGYSITVHYRHAAVQSTARAAIRSAASALGDARVIGGIQSLHLLPAAAPDKGVALLEARELLHCERALYVGDGENDEDVFALGCAHRLLTIRVGRSRDSLAAYYIRDQAEIDVLLGRLLALAEARRTRETP